MGIGRGFFLKHDTFVVIHFDNEAVCFPRALNPFNEARSNVEVW